MKHLLSIIIPVYNTDARFLERCLSSTLEAADYAELLVVNDGSGDITTSFLRERLDSLNIEATLIERPNGGQNAARNSGIDRASGEYLLFLDSDDYYTPGSLLGIIATLKSNKPQLLGFNSKVVDESGVTFEERVRFAEGLADVDKREILISSASLAVFAFHRDLFEGGSRLLEGPRIAEDLASLIPLIIRAGSIQGLELTAYNYVQHSGSTVHQVSPEIAFDVLEAFDGLILSVGSDFDEFYEEIEWLSILHILYFGSIRVIDSIGFDTASKRRLFDYVSDRFPNWKSNRILRSRFMLHGMSFPLLINGWWRIYWVLRAVKNL